MTEQEKITITTFLKGIGLDDQLISSILEWLGNASNSISTKENLTNQLELLKYSIRRAWESLSTVSSLAAMLLIVATFNSNLISINDSVRILLTILLLIIPLGVWLNFIDSTKAMDSSLDEMIKTIEKSNIVDKDNFKDLIKKGRKPTLKGILPFLTHCIFTLAVLLIILLVWKIDLIAFLVR